MKFKLNRTGQCLHCPFRKDSNLDKIDGYSLSQHKDLKKTIANQEQVDILSNRETVQLDLKIMACHHSTEDKKEMCVGWVSNQLRKNNILLRIAMMNCENLKEIKTLGSQYENFEDTIK